MIRLLPVLFAALALWATAAAAEPELLEPEKAFRFSARMTAPDAAEVRFQIAKGYYLYREKFAFAAEPPTVQLGAAKLPQGEKKHDDFFGDVEIYRGDLRFVVPVTAAGGVERFTLVATLQGCADIGVCYPPQEGRAELVLAALSQGAPGAGSPWVAGGADSTLAQGLDATDERIAELFNLGFWAVVASFFGFGLLLAFTPCVFPMIPILSGILVPHGEHLTRARGLALSATYVLGMALTYAVAGVIAGLAGAMLSAALQSPWVVGAFAALFVLLALSMFGLYELQLPPALQTRLAMATNRLHGGHFAGVFAMGVLSALIVGPCVAAPLAGALLYIGQSRDVVLGGSALFAMALGMGVPLLVVGASAGALLPKAGPWMESVKRFFGVMLVAVAIWLVSPFIPVPAQMLAWAALLILWAIYLHALDPLPPHAPAWRRLAKGFGVIALITGAALLVGAFSGGRDVLQPLSGLRAGAAEPGSRAAPEFRTVADVAELDAALAATGGKPVMLDFYADWCVSCREMEAFTFPDPTVRARLDRMVLLKADVTANTPEHKALLKRFGLFGPPGIIFFDAAGREIKGLRVIGFQAAPKFAANLDRALQ